MTTKRKAKDACWVCAEWQDTLDFVISPSYPLCLSTRVEAAAYASPLRKGFNKARATQDGTPFFRSCSLGLSASPPQAPWLRKQKSMYAGRHLRAFNKASFAESPVAMSLATLRAARGRNCTTSLHLPREPREPREPRLARRAACASSAPAGLIGNSRVERESTRTSRGNGPGLCTPSRGVMCLPGMQKEPGNSGQRSENVHLDLGSPNEN